MSLPTYSIVIASKDRGSFLRDTLKDIGAQTMHPEKVVVVDVSEERLKPLPVPYTLEIYGFPENSSAKQRNFGAEKIQSNLVCFLDDDVRLPPNHFESLLKSWETTNPTAVCGRINGLTHTQPKGFLKAYYRFQAGYSHKDYGAHVFGPAINCVPTYKEPEPLIPAQWLNSTCLLVNTDHFRREKFPDFTGYSWGEDLHLTTRLAKHGELYFQAQAAYEHVSVPTTEKKDMAHIARMQMYNQFRISTECLDRSTAWTTRRLQLHALFVSAYLLKSKNDQALAFLNAARKRIRELRTAEVSV